MLPITVRRLSLSCMLSLPFALALAMMPLTQAQVPDSQTPENTGETQPTSPTPENTGETQPDSPTPEATGEPQSEDLTDPNNLRPLTQADSLLSLQGGQRLMAEAIDAIDAEQYQVAANKFQEARKIFNQLSNFHLQLASSFSGIENRISEAQRRKALETGQMRDEATYQLALVHRAQNQPELAVPLLIQVIRSQNPTSELGKKSYQQLFELGFVDSPYSTSGK